MTEFVNFYLNWLIFVAVCAVGCCLFWAYGATCKWLDGKYDGAGDYFVGASVVFVFLPGVIFVGKLLVGEPG